jgi:hypothetical protein
MLVATAGSRPVLGTTLTLTASRLAPGTATVGLLGASPTQWLGLALPLDLSPIGMTQCVLYNSVDVIEPLLNLNGEAVWSLPIPDDMALLEASFFVQAFALDAAANRLGAVLTNGTAALIGSL